MTDEDDVEFRLRKRAEIRRQITTRKSVQEGAPDRIADLLDEGANEIVTLRLQREMMGAALKDVTVHLIAAHSLLSNSPKTAAASDKMFDQMLRDYKKAFEHGQDVLFKTEFFKLRGSVPKDVDWST